MGYRWALLATLLGFLSLPVASPASTGDVGNIIEKFVIHQFPQSVGHYWIINETQWDGDEMIVDLHTIVKERREMDPTLSRYLLLIVAGELKGVQNIPLEPGTECKAEEEA
ncbi:MAG TPA: hypothetical protein VJ746_04045 [Nitrospira sp.]|nr:hypothetical protein [Nitrospira sp.]